MKSRCPVRILPLLALSLAPVLGAGCKSAYYRTMEGFGQHKRDILVSRVEDGKREQAEAQEQFESTFERFKRLTGVRTSELEEVYNSLKRELDRCEDEAKDVREEIASIDEVALDLFEEWEEELEQIQSSDLRSQSRRQLETTRSRYDSLIEAMRRAEATMDPVLVAFRDHVLFLKHNLNAQAVASLSDTVVSIQDDVERLIRDMQDSIRRAEEFIATMEGAPEQESVPRT